MHLKTCTSSRGTLARVFLAGTASIALLLAAPAAAPAVVNGTPDQTHSYVGALFRIDPQGQTYFLCSGSLLGSREFLTGGHCVEAIEPGDQAAVSFAPTLDGPFDPYTGATGPQSGAVRADAWITHPAFSAPGNNKAVNDVGLVHLAKPVHQVGSVSLPAANADGALTKGQVLTVVGYGLDGFVNGAPVWTGTRQFAHGVFNDLTPGFLDVSFDYATGAPCAGDSGGPLFAGDSSNVVLGMVSWGRMGGCGGLGHNQRVDTPSILDWLLHHTYPSG